MALRSTLEEFINKSNDRHDHLYDYSKSEYMNSRSKITIICKTHGEFYQKPYIHLGGSGCPECNPTKKLDTNEFIKRSLIVHNNLYDYSPTVYGNNNYDTVKIICKSHGIFDQRPWAHLRGQGCPKCSNNRRSTTTEFIDKSIKKHGNIYDYSLTKYKNKRDKIKIICVKHGIFNQRPYVHIQGHGCPICKNSKLEKYLRKKLINLKIKFEQNKRYDDCRNILPLPFDFYLTDHNTLLECDGVQHHKPIKFFGGEDRLEYQINNDKIKNEYCCLKGIDLFRLNSLKEIDTTINNLIYRKWESL